MNILLDTDSYKASHWLQFPPGTNYMACYLESRGGEFGVSKFFGLQYILKEYLSKGFSGADIEEAKEFFSAHGVPFNYDGFQKMFLKYCRPIEDKIIVVPDSARKKPVADFPIRIRAVKEGEVVPTKNALMVVESTDPEFFWIVGYLETMIMRIWYPATVATLSYYCRKTIMEFLNRTSDNPEMEIDFKLHDFGSRGVSSYESAGIGGMAHLTNFKGSDTVAGVVFAKKYYNEPMAGFSIPAAEHSTITSWGRDQEANAYENMLKQFGQPGKILAVVSDSYNLWNAIENIWGRDLKERIIESGATLVIRPDSGDPVKVVLECMRKLEERFGVTVNSKGYKVLNYVRVIQGDGINRNMIFDILQAMYNEGYSASNIAFGMGGGLLQQVNRDTMKFAYKCSVVGVNGKFREVYKDPITDPGKKSKCGFVSLVKENGGYKTLTSSVPFIEGDDEFEVVFENGKILKEYTLEEIRKA